MLYRVLGAADLLPGAADLLQPAAGLLQFLLFPSLPLLAVGTGYGIELLPEL